MLILLWKSWLLKTQKVKQTEFGLLLNRWLLSRLRPSAHQDRQVGKYAGRGYKQLLIDNYVAIYKIDEQNKTVYVVTVQYQGRNI